MNPLPDYPGAKTSVAKRLVSLMPPHQVYVEGFLGSGAVLRIKKPAAQNVGYDLDPGVVQAWKKWDCHVPNVQIFQQDFVDLAQKKATVLRLPQVLVYLDPPYLRRTRTRLFYEHEMHDPLRHATLLAALRDLPCLVMISHYPDELYFAELADWRCHTYTVQTHGGPRRECCWMNFPEPAIFHDPRFLGDGYRERERIKRKAKRWEERFRSMPASERAAIAAALARVDPATAKQAIQSGPT